jgi:hypothetical protein
MSTSNTNKLTNYFQFKSANKENAKQTLLQKISKDLGESSQESDSEIGIWKKITSSNKNIVPPEKSIPTAITYDDDDDDEIVCIGTFSSNDNNNKVNESIQDDEISCAQLDSTNKTNEISRYTQEDISTLGVDDGPEVITLSDKSNDTENDEDDDDNDLIIFLEKNPSILEKVDGKSMTVETEKCNVVIDDDDVMLIEIADKTEIEYTLNQSIVKSYADNSKYSTFPKKLLQDRFDFLLNDDKNNEEVMKPVEEPLSTENLKKRTRESDAEQSTIDDRNEQLWKEKYENFIERTKTKTPAKTTILLNTPKRLKGLPEVSLDIESPIIKPKCKTRLIQSSSSSSSSSSSQSSTRSTSPVAPTEQEPMVTSTTTDTTNPTISLDAIKKKMIRIATNQSRFSKTPHTTSGLSSTNRHSKIGNWCKNNRSREANLLLNSSIAKPKKFPSSSNGGSVSLTQGIRLAKFELKARAVLAAPSERPQKISRIEDIEEKEEEARPVVAPKIAIAKPSTLKDIPRKGFVKPVTSGFKKPTIHKTIEKPNILLKPTTSLTTEPSVVKEDLVGEIKRSCNIRDVVTSRTIEPLSNHEEDSKKYDFDKFLVRILNCAFNWLEEQEKQNKPPPVVDDNELIPLVDRYVSYDDYYKTMFPLLLLETWEEVSDY